VVVHNASVEWPIWQGGSLWRSCVQWLLWPGGSSHQEDNLDRMTSRMMAAAGGEARPNDIFGSVTATSGEARLCGMFGTTVIATYHF
jgi:hypothetical protein